MDVYIAGRRAGKTTMLIKESSRTGATIAVATYEMAQYVEFLAINLGLNIPHPVTYADIFRNFRENKTKRYLVDELQMMLHQLNVDTVTLGLQDGHSPRVYILDERHRVTPFGVREEVNILRNAFDPTERATASTEVLRELMQRGQDYIEIRDILMNADAISCDAECYERTCHLNNTTYHVPNGHRVQIDFNKLAKAIYDAGYRKGENND